MIGLNNCSCQLTTEREGGLLGTGHITVVQTVSEVAVFAFCMPVRDELSHHCLSTKRVSSLRSSASAAWTFQIAKDCSSSPCSRALYMCCLEGATFFFFLRSAGLSSECTCLVCQATWGHLECFTSGRLRAEFCTYSYFWVPYLHLAYRYLAKLSELGSSCILQTFVHWLALQRRGPVPSAGLAMLRAI